MLSRRYFHWFRSFCVCLTQYFFFVLIICGCFEFLLRFLVAWMQCKRRLWRLFIVIADHVMCDVKQPNLSQKCVRAERNIEMNHFVLQTLALPQPIWNGSTVLNLSWKPFLTPLSHAINWRPTTDQHLMLRQNQQHKLGLCRMLFIRLQVQLFPQQESSAASLTTYMKCGRINCID